MVLDIRYLRSGSEPEDTESPAEAKATEAQSGEAQAVQIQAAEPQADPSIQALEMTAGPEASGPAPGANLDELLTRAAEGDDAADRAEAVACLRSLVPSPEGVERLGDILESADDSRRVVAAQVLGHHRQWLAQTSGLARLVGWARAERDPEVGAALVWGLRNRDAAQEFLLHPILGMAREAAMGVPVAESTIEALVQALVVGRSPDIDRILGDKLRAVRSSLVPAVVDLLLEQMGGAGSQEITAVVAHLPQVPLFRVFIQGQGAPQWRPDQTAAESRRARNWHQLAALVESVLLAGPDPELVRHLVSHTARDEAFARRHAAFLEAAGKSGAAFSPELLHDLSRLTATASNDKLGRLAELLVELSGRLDGDSARRAQALLEDWKARSPDLKLRIYHLQQGVK